MSHPLDDMGTLFIEDIETGERRATTVAELWPDKGRPFFSTEAADAGSAAQWDNVAGSFELTRESLEAAAKAMLAGNDRLQLQPPVFVPLWLAVGMERVARGLPFRDHFAQPSRPESQGKRRRSKQWRRGRR